MVLLIFANKQIQTLSGKTSSMIVKKLEMVGSTLMFFASNLCIFDNYIIFLWGERNVVSC